MRTRADITRDLNKEIIEKVEGIVARKMALPITVLGPDRENILRDYWWKETVAEKLVNLAVENEDLRGKCQKLSTVDGTLTISETGRVARSKYLKAVHAALNELGIDREKFKEVHGLDSMWDLTVEVAEGLFMAAFGPKA